LRRVILAFALLAVVAMDIALVAVGVAQSSAFFAQSGARAFALEPVFALLGYALAIVFLARTHSPSWDSLLRGVIVFGVMTGIIEVLNVGVENGVPFALHGPFLSTGSMLIIFTSWGIAGFRAARSQGSTRAGLLVAVCSAGICMLIAVTAGFFVQFFVSPPDPAYVSTWAEFKRSGWTDARAFAVANTLESGFTHIVVAPIVALFCGAIGSWLAQFRSSRIAPISR
jgi:hypothetical protein